MELTERAPFYVSYHARAQAHAGNEETARSFALLEEAVRARNGWIGTVRLPLFDDFRGDPRYAALLTRIGHPDTEASRPPLHVRAHFD